MHLRKEGRPQLRGVDIATDRLQLVFVPASQEERPREFPERRTPDLLLYCPKIPFRSHEEADHSFVQN